jgi:hypothetical protein
MNNSLSHPSSRIGSQNGSEILEASCRPEGLDRGTWVNSGCSGELGRSSEAKTPAGLSIPAGLSCPEIKPKGTSHPEKVKQFAHFSGISLADERGIR